MLLSLDIIKSLNAKAIAVAGSDLLFPSLGVEVQGIPGFDLQILYRGLDSPYAIEAPNPVFRITTEDFESIYLANEKTVEGLMFTMKDPSFQYSFEIQEAVPDLNGWIYLNCILKEKEF